jgi:hypothetical protein
MLFALSLVVAARTVIVRMPMEMRGVWDIAEHCRLEFDDSGSRMIVRENSVAFLETVFTPKRIVKSDRSTWTAAGEFDEYGETSKGRLILHLSHHGRRLSVSIDDGKPDHLVRCTTHHNAPAKTTGA